MTIDLSDQLTSRLESLANQQGCELGALVEEAVRRYLDDAAITDVSLTDVAATQEKLIGELTSTPPWSQEAGSEDSPETPDNATQ